MRPEATLFGIYAAFGLLYFGTEYFGSYGITPVAGLSRPMLNRVPGDARLARFTEIVSGMFNSLAANGQLLLKGQNDWTLNVVFLTTVDPTSADDSSLGHFAGQFWANVAAQTAWVCYSATPGSVVWLQLAISSNDVDSGVGPPAAAQGSTHDVYFDVTDPTNPLFYFKS